MGSFAVQRSNMVESQVRPSDVVDRRIIRAMLEIPREVFVPADIRPLAYIDREVPVTSGAENNGARYLLAPSDHARLIQALELESNAIVLDVGCGTGYGSTIMAKLAQTVVGLEEDPELAERATRTLADLSVDNVVVVTGKLCEGWPGEGPYDAILLNGAVQEMPPALLEQLKDGGRLAAVVSDTDVGKATIWQRSGPNFPSRVIFEAAAKPLPGFEKQPTFVF